MNEERCWICRRTSVDLTEIAEKDNMLDYFGEHSLFDSPSLYGNDVKYRVKLCPVCRYLIEIIALEAVADNFTIQLKETFTNTHHWEK